MDTGRLHRGGHFFVISGYLISKIVLAGIEAGKFSLSGFYERRVRRIFPALIAILAASLALGWWTLLADEYRQLGKHIAGGTTFVSNFTFWRESGYFDNGAETKPMLHLWSLAIEEQFYVFWPLLLVAVIRRKWNFFAITAAIGLCSFAANIFLAHGHAVADFYLPVSRAWELMIGGLLAYLSLHRPALISRHENLQSALGAILLALGFALIDRNDVFPGWWALLPTLGAFFIIAGGSEGWINRHLLSNRVLVWLGLISYPLYLWHWPILAFSRIILEKPLSPAQVAVAVAASIFLAWLTYHFAEKKVRASRTLLSLRILVAAFALLFLASGLVYVAGGFPSHPIARQLDAASAGNFFEASRRSDGSCEKLNGLQPAAEEVCLSNSAAPRVLIAGDSHAMALYSSIFSRDLQLDSILLGGHACQLYPNLQYTPARKVDFGNNCTAIADRVIQAAHTLNSIETVVLANNYPYLTDAQDKVSIYAFGAKRLTNREAFTAGSGAMIASLLKAGKRVIFFVDVPRLVVHPHDCIRRLPLVDSQRCEPGRAEHDALRLGYMTAVVELKARYPGLEIYDPTDVLCNRELCSAGIDGHPLYYDAEHISVFASKKLLDLMRMKSLLSP